MLLILEKNEKFKLKFLNYFEKAGFAPLCVSGDAEFLAQLQSQTELHGCLINLHGQNNLSALMQIRNQVNQRNLPTALLFSPQSANLAQQLRTQAKQETYFELPCKLSKLAAFLRDPQAATDPMIGKEIGPEGHKVKILRKLGAGAMGSVYEACQSTLDRRVAVKFLKLDYLDNDSDALLRFQNEAKAVARLRSGHILQVYFIGFHQGQAYSVMEYIDGMPLDLHMKKDRRITPTCALKLTIEILRGLHEAHENGIIHRDIKPANVMINSRGQAVILDFGLVRSQTNPVMTQTNALLGTPRYMAPEQISGKLIDHRADIYALGIMLYEMTVGKPPFQGNDMVSLLMKHIHEPLPHPESHGVLIDPRLFQFIEKLCTKNRDHRVQNAQEGLAIAEQLLAEIKDVDSTATLAFGMASRNGKPEQGQSDKLFIDTGDLHSHDSLDAENQSIAVATSAPSLSSVANVSFIGKQVPAETVNALLEIFTEFLGPLARRLAMRSAKKWGLDLDHVPASKWSTLLNGLGEMIENPSKQEQFLDRAVLLKKSF